MKQQSFKERLFYVLEELAFQKKKNFNKAWLFVLLLERANFQYIRTCSFESFLEMALAYGFFKQERTGIFVLSIEKFLEFFPEKKLELQEYKKIKEGTEK